uniref:Uncharacterized protein n=1 Tax=Aegilops tauschii subsp. strangulata TaxID=200361 RepID=A0A453SPQ0_AEGTS
ANDLGPVPSRGDGDGDGLLLPTQSRSCRLKASYKVELAKMLLNEGQGHLFEHWPEPGVHDDKKKNFFDQVSRLNSSYPGGLAAYIQNAKKLLADSKAGQNPYDGFTPSVSLAMHHFL